MWSVRTAADPDDPADVLTLDERRLASLEEVFWDMNAIDFEVQERRVEEIVEVEQEDGTVAEGTETVTRQIQIQSASRARSCHGLLNGKAGTDFSVGPGLLCGSVTVFMRKGRMLSALKIKISSIGFFQRPPE